MNAPALRVLLVEDNLADAVLLKEYLKELGGARPHVLTAERLEDAVQLLAREPVDVVLLDLSLPDASGPSTVRRAHLAAPEVPIVVLTGLDDDRAAILAVQEGAQDYLIKGKVDGPLLSRSLRYAVERKRAEGSARRAAQESAARSEAEASAARWRLLSEASRALASSLEVGRTLSEVAGLVVQVLADYCAIDLREPLGMRRVASEHADPSRELLAEALAHFPSIKRPERSVLSESGTMTLNRAEFLSQESQSPEHRAMLEQLDPGGSLAVEIRAHGKVLGRMLLVSGRERELTAPEQAVAEELATRIALALENSQLHRAREEILGVVSHDLRNPLSVVALSASMLRSETLSAERRRQQLAKLDRSVAEMRRLIDDLLDASRLDGRGIPVSRAQLHPRELIEEARERLSPLAEARNIAWLSELPESLPWVEADRERCLQVFSNVIGNALKFTPPGGSVTVTARPETNVVRFEVRDTGVGIPAEDLPRVFDRFFQAREGANRGRGAGLGLTIARGVIEAHGGEISLRSEPGKGTTVCFTLPTSPAQGEDLLGTAS